MRVLAYTWAGVRTADLDSTARFFSHVLGLSPRLREESLVQFELPSGQLFEVFAETSRYYRLHTCPVLAFEVENVRTAREEMEAQGVRFETAIDGDETVAWTYFRGPDGYLYELVQTNRALKDRKPEDPRP